MHQWFNLPHVQKFYSLRRISQEEIRHGFSESRTLDPMELKPAREYVEDVIDLFYPQNGVELVRELE